MPPDPDLSQKRRIRLENMEQKNLRVGKIDKITERAVLGFVVSCKIKRPKKETHRENSGIMLSDENKNRRYQYESSK